jgi:hypothetical protein
MDDRPARVRFWAWYTPPWRHRTAVAALFLAVAATYAPALHHPPRQDQWSFLLDTVHEDRFWPMLVQTYSYNRTRVIGWGDYPLFRPVLFAALCAEKALFGHRYAYWQAVGVALHCGVVWVFLRILLRLHRAYPAASPRAGRLRRALAYVLALFFAVNFVGTEMVSWSHIHGYLIFALLVLAGWLPVLDELCGLPPGRGGALRLGAAFFLTLLASFAYETGACYAACLGAALGLARAGRGQARRGLLVFALFAAVLPVNRAADWLDRQSHPEMRPDVTEATVLERAQWEPTLDHTRRYLLFTLCQPFFPSCPEWRFDDRLLISEPAATPEAYWRPDPLLYLSYAVVAAGAALALAQLVRLRAGRRLLAGSPFLLVPASLILLHLAIIVLGRMNLRPGPAVIARNSYYAYTPLVALLAALYYLWVRLPPAWPRAASAALAVVLVGLAVLSGASALTVHAMTDKMRGDYRLLAAHIDRLQRTIDRNRHDPGFALSFDPDLFYSLEQYHAVPLVEILFCRFLDHENPSHVVCRDGEIWRVLTAEQYRRRYGGPRYRELATFVRAGTEYMVFRHGRRYYGVHYQQGRFRTDRHDYHHLVEGDSVEEVLRQVPGALRRLEAERRAPAPPPPWYPWTAPAQFMSWPAFGPANP